MATTPWDITRRTFYPWRFVKTVLWCVQLCHERPVACVAPRIRSPGWSLWALLSPLPGLGRGRAGGEPGEGAGCTAAHGRANCPVPDDALPPPEPCLHQPWAKGVTVKPNVVASFRKIRIMVT